jgi:hypothetical protein
MEFSSFLLGFISLSGSADYYALIYNPLSSRADAVMVACHSWQLVTAVCDVEGDGSDTL